MHDDLEKEDIDLNYHEIIINLCGWKHEWGSSKKERILDDYQYF